MQMKENKHTTTTNRAIHFTWKQRLMFIYTNDQSKNPPGVALYLLPHKDKNR